jgi:hypothetical protein
MLHYFRDVTLNKLVLDEAQWLAFAVTVNFLCSRIRTNYLRMAYTVKVKVKLSCA